MVEDCSDDISMEFGFDKCAKATFTAQKFFVLFLDVNTTVRNLEQADIDKYLKIYEGDGIQHSKTKEKVRKECYRRIRLVLESELNASNMINAINSLAIPVVTYSLGILKWGMFDRYFTD